MIQAAQKRKERRCCLDESKNTSLVGLLFLYGRELESLSTSKRRRSVNCGRLRETSRSKQHRLFTGSSSRRELGRPLSSHSCHLHIEMAYIQYWKPKNWKFKKKLKGKIEKIEKSMHTYKGKGTSIIAQTYQRVSKLSWGDVLATKQGWKRAVRVCFAKSITLALRFNAGGPCRRYIISTEASKRICITTVSESCHG